MSNVINVEFNRGNENNIKLRKNFYNFIENNIFIRKNITEIKSNENLFTEDVFDDLMTLAIDLLLLSALCLKSINQENGAGTPTNAKIVQVIIGCVEEHLTESLEKK